MTRWLVLTMILAPVAAHAQTFPDDDRYVPLRCAGDVMTDPIGDQPPALLERDIVGDRNAPAALRAADADFLYLRIRVDRDPAPGGVVQPYAWGMAFDLDGTRSTYELLITADGIDTDDGTVSVFTNDAITIANSPADPADDPPALTAAFADVARTIGAGTTNNGDADYFVDIAVPWDELVPLGLDRGTRTYVWVGSSSVPDALDGDIACHDGRSGGSARLDAVVSDETTGDPDGGGGGGGGGSGLRLEGGSGCQAGRATGLGSVGILVALLALCRLPSRRRSPSRRRG